MIFNFFGVNVIFTGSENAEKSNKMTFREHTYSQKPHVTFNHCHDEMSVSIGTISARGFV